MTLPKILLFVLTCSVLNACVTEGELKPQTQASPEEAAAVNLQLGSTYLRRGDVDAAIQKLQKAVEQNPQLAGAHAALALAYERVSQADEADRHYRLAIKHSEEDPAINNMYGAYLCRNNKLSEAEKYFIAAATDPTYTTPEAAFTNAGVCALRNEELQKAEDFFRSALRVNPRYPDALWQMAELSHKRDRDLQARAFLQRLDDSGGLPAGALWLGIQVERKLGDSKTAASYARKLKTEFPDSRETGLLLEQERNGG